MLRKNFFRIILSCITVMFLISNLSLANPNSSTGLNDKNDVIKVTGGGVTPAKCVIPITIARQAALLDCYRQIAEQMEMMKHAHDQDTPLENMSFLNDTITTHIICNIDKLNSMKILSGRCLPDGSYEVIIEVQKAELKKYIQHEGAVVKIS